MNNVSNSQLTETQYSLSYIVELKIIIRYLSDVLMLSLLR